MSKRDRQADTEVTERPRQKQGKTPRRKPATQVAALCIEGASGRVLLITSRDTGRWVIPKGWPIRKLSLPGTALQEAWEEAGVKGLIGKRELGRYHYDKRRDHGFAVPVEVRVFPIAVSRLADTFPEAGQRRRDWRDPSEAAGMVDEEGLQALIRDLPGQLAGGLLKELKKRK